MKEKKCNKEKREIELTYINVDKKKNKGESDGN